MFVSRLSGFSLQLRVKYIICFLAWYDRYKFQRLRYIYQTVNRSKFNILSSILVFLVYYRFRISLPLQSVMLRFLGSWLNITNSYKNVVIVVITKLLFNFHDFRVFETSFHWLALCITRLTLIVTFYVIDHWTVIMQILHYFDWNLNRACVCRQQTRN